MKTSKIMLLSLYLLLNFMLTGCGQPGPLYLPSDSPEPIQSK
ncbi:MAG: lipopeptide [Methylococcaceae bacterium]|nr:MAG: lipopeptide [Methylococcaceae bacterium]